MFCLSSYPGIYCVQTYSSSALTTFKKLLHPLRISDSFCRTFVNWIFPDRIKNVVVLPTSKMVILNFSPFRPITNLQFPTVFFPKSQSFTASVFCRRKVQHYSISISPLKLPLLWNSPVGHKFQTALWPKWDTDFFAVICLPICCLRHSWI